ncbi:hypothetical protein ACSS6W_007998 [Trichoderma asperelloides]
MSGFKPTESSNLLTIEKEMCGNESFISNHASYMAKTYDRASLVFTRGQGSYLWDMENRRDWNCKLSKLLVEKTREAGSMGDAAAVFLSNSGSEANEAAFKFARKYGKSIDPSGNKFEIVSFHGSYHGRTFGSLSATPRPIYQDAFAPLVPGHRYGTFNETDGLVDLINPRTCAVIVEPIQGEGGVHVGSEDFMTKLCDRAREVGAIVIYDEIQCGLGRTGSFWAHTKLPPRAHPDIITCAKALGNGYPISATIVGKKIADVIHFGDHGSTYGGNPLGASVAHHILHRLSDESTLRHVMSMAQLLRAGLLSLQQKYPTFILDIRGDGLMIGVQVDRHVNTIVASARKNGLLIMTAQNNVIRILPTLNITPDEIRQALEILEKVLIDIQ